jgi:hypothetical protein
MPDLWKTEYVVVDRDGNEIDWVPDKQEAIDQAEPLGGKVIRIKEYLTERDEVWPVSSDAYDDED